MIQARLGGAGGAGENLVNPFKKDGSRGREHKNTRRSPLNLENAHIQERKSDEKNWAAQERNTEFGTWK